MKIGLLGLFAAILALLSFQPTHVAADNWAVLVAGSDTYSNYRHQADTCHAYQIMKKNGISDDHIIVFMKDDIANNARNPMKGQLFNKPTPKGVPGVDVYAGCPKHYTGANVTPKNFLNAITGNSSSVPPGLPVLKSGPEDNVFIYFTDHGAPGLIAFPTQYLYASDLIPALKYMADNKRFNRMVFYLEACESGSMFSGLLDPSWNIYATTAANPTESSWGAYCPPQDQVNGVSIGSCLGDEYSVNWMENTEAVGLKQSLQTQFETVRNLTQGSHVMQYGQLAWTDAPIGDFQGEAGKKHKSRRGAAATATEPRQKSEVTSRDVPMHVAYYRYLRAAHGSPEAKFALAELRAELDAREKADDLFQSLSVSLARGHPHHGLLSSSPASLMAPVTEPITDSADCIKEAVDALQALGCDYNDYSLQYHKVIVNACNHFSKQDEQAAIQFITSQIKTHCKA